MTLDAHFLAFPPVTISAPGRASSRKTGNPEVIPHPDSIGPVKRRYRNVGIPAIPSVREADLFFSGLEGVARSNPEQLDIEQLSGGRQQ